MSQGSPCTPESLRWSSTVSPALHMGTVRSMYETLRRTTVDSIVVALRATIVTGRHSVLTATEGQTIKAVVSREAYFRHSMYSSNAAELQQQLPGKASARKESASVSGELPDVELGH